MSGKSALPIGSSDVQAAIAVSELRACDEYRKAFDQQSRASTGKVSEAWKELRLIASLYPAFDGAGKEPLGGIHAIDSVSDERLESWACLADEVGDADLIARCSDLCWLRRRAGRPSSNQSERARIAVIAYANAASSLGLEDHSIQCFTRMQRALRLAKTLGASEMRAQIAEKVLGMLRSADPAKYGNYAGAARVIALLRGENVDCAAECIAWCEAAARQAEGLARDAGGYIDYEVARAYLEEKISWLRKEGHSSDIEETWRRIAANHMEVSTAFANSGLPTPNLTASKWMEDAIAALRQANAPAGDIELAYQRLLALQAKGVKELKPQGQAIDVTAMAQAAISRITAQTFVDALLGFATCADVPSASRVQAVIDAQDGVVRHFAVEQINRRGMRTAFRDGYADGEEFAVDAELVSSMRGYQRVIAQGAVAPARETMLDTHPVTYTDMMHLSLASPFVPRGREAVYARGLFAGFEGDWVLVAHLLPPQIENSLRLFCESAGVISSGLHRGRQHDFDLNKLFGMEEVEKVLGPDLLLDMKASFAHGFGSNVRNLMAHGLLDDREFETSEVMYAWWLALRLVLLLPVLVPAARADEPANVAPSPPRDGETAGPLKDPAPPEPIQS